MNCSNCGAAIDYGLADCPACLAPVRKPSLWQRLRGLFADSTLPPAVFVGANTQKFGLLNKETGQWQVYNSLEEAPPEFRTLLEQARAGGTDVKRSVCFSFQGPGTEKQVYDSLEQMPPAMQALFRQSMPPEFDKLLEGPTASASEPHDEAK